MKTALCIIDMQNEFTPQATKALPETLRQIELAKRRNAPIVLVELERSGSTLKPIKEALKKIPKENLFVVKKTTQGGGNQINRMMVKYKVDISRIRCVGVNTCQCVHDTVMELQQLKRVKFVEISLKGCSCWCATRSDLNMGKKGDYHSKAYFSKQGVKVL